MIKLQITFKSGAQIEFWVKEWTKRTIRLSNEVVGFSWEHDPNKYPRLSHLRIEDVVAVVVMEGEDED